MRDSEQVEHRESGGKSKSVRSSSMRDGEVRADLIKQLSHALHVQMQAISASSAAMRRLHPDELLLREAAMLLERSARRMDELLFDLLDLVASEYGTLRLERAGVTFQRLVDNALRAHRVAIEQRRLRIVCSMPRQGVMLECDTVRMQRVVTHVLADAIERTPQGGYIVLRCVRSDGEVALEITDAAPTMSAEAFPILLEPRLRVQPSEGHSFGLHLARALIEAHGGRFARERLGDSRDRYAIILPS